MLKTITKSLNNNRQLNAALSPSGAIFAVCLIAGYMFVLSLGPTLQEYASKLLSSNSTSIYESICESCITQFPSLWKWMVGNLDWASLSVSVLTVFICYWIKDVKLIFLASLCISFFTLSIIDLITTDWSHIQLGIQVPSNAFGAPILSSIFTLMMYGAFQLYSFFPGVHGITKALSVVSPLILGLSISSIVFVLARFFLAAGPVAIQASTSNYISGYYAVKKKGNKKDDKSSPETKVGTLSPRSTSGLKDLHWNSMSGSTNVRWMAGDDKSTYKLIVLPLAGCLNLSDALQLKSSNANAMVFRNVRRFRLRLDSGVNNFDLDTGSRVPATIDFSENGVNAFWVSRDIKAGIVRTDLLGKFLPATFSSRAGEYRFLLNGMNVAEDNFRSPKERILTLSVDGIEKTLVFRPSMELRSTQPIGCKSSDIGKVDGLKKIYSIDSIVSGVLVLLEAKDEDHIFLKRKADPLTVKGSEGSMSFSREVGANYDENGEIVHAPLRMFFGKSQYDQLYVNGEKVRAYRNQMLQLAGGAVDIVISARGQIGISGKPNLAWFGGERLNVTRWEALPSAGRFAILGVLFGSVLALGKFLFAILTAGTPITISASLSSRRCA